MKTLLLTIVACAVSVSAAAAQEVVYRSTLTEQSVETRDLLTCWSQSMRMSVLRSRCATLEPVSSVGTSSMAKVPAIPARFS